MDDEPKISDRLQYVIGAVISIVLVTVYLVASSVDVDTEEERSLTPSAPAELIAKPLEKPSPNQALSTPAAQSEEK